MNGSPTRRAPPAQQNPKISASPKKAGAGAAGKNAAEADISRGISQDETTTLRYSSTISVRLTWELPIKVPRNCAVSYRFTTSPADISFGLVFCDATGTESTLKEVDRVPSHIGAANGTIHPACEGTIYFRWDNSYSWLTAKELTYLIEVSRPGGAAAGEESSVERTPGGLAVAGLVAELSLKREIKTLHEKVSELEVESAKAKEDLVQLDSKCREEMRNMQEKLNAALALKATLEGELKSIKTLLENVQAHRKESESRHNTFTAAQNARYESEISALKAAEYEAQLKKLGRDTECDKMRDALEKSESALRNLRVAHESELRLLKEKKGAKLHAALADKARLEQELASLKKAGSVDLQAQHETLSRVQKEAQVSRDEARVASDKLKALVEDKARLEQDLVLAKTSITHLQAGGDALKKYEHEVNALRAANESLTANEQELRVQRAANDALRNELTSLKAANDSLVNIQNHTAKQKREAAPANRKILEVTNVLITAPDIPVDIPPLSLRPPPADDAAPEVAPQAPQAAAGGGVEMNPSRPPAAAAGKQAGGGGDMHPLLVPVNAGLFVLTLGQVNAWTAEGAAPESGQMSARDVEAGPLPLPRSHGDRELNALKSSKAMRASVHQAHAHSTANVDPAAMSSPGVPPPPQLPLKGILKKQPESPARPPMPAPVPDNSQQKASENWGWLGKL